MPDLIQISDDLTFALSNAHFAYVFRVSQEGVLEHLHYGGPLSDPLGVPRHPRRMNRHVVPTFQGTPYYSLSDTPQEYSSFGTSDYRFPAFHGQNADGNTVFSLLYETHEIVEVKPPLHGLPSSRGDGSQTLIVTLHDRLHGLRVTLSYTVWADYGVLARSATFENLSDHDIDLRHVFSSALDLPADDYEIQHFHGTWSREFNEERIALPQGRFVADSARGTSSSAHNPYVAILQAGATESFGRCYGTTLVYSGNFAISVEKGEFDDVRVLAGLNPFNFNWRLKPGKIFTTPEALHTFSGRGLGALSHHWHDFIRDRVSPERFRHVPRPTYLNTWEAAYFDIDEDKVLSLAETAKQIGVDMVVLDDGWFDGRQDDTSSLGDWGADPVRFPSGIPALAAKVKAKGLKFGIWVEPEMVNPQSQLYAQHPDWILHVPDRVPSLGRNQLTLDLSRADVQDYLFDSLNAILSCGDVDYVKWDMNRTMTEVGSAALPRKRQQETPHRYMLGLYALLDRLVASYPEVLFENCASGGNRFDLGMLSYMPQGWISDMCDPIGRLAIIGGASHLFPLDVMAAYIGPSPNHQNGRVSSVRTRFLAGAFCAARGVSLGQADIAAHQRELSDWMRFAQDTKADMVGGRFDRVKKTENEVAWQYSSRDGQTIYLTYFHSLSGPNMPARRVYYVGLEPTAAYHHADSKVIYRGDALMQSGLPLPRVSAREVASGVQCMPEGDFSAYLFVLRRI
ncbi:alpha-galactosidase [Algimonas arctica]|uniref:Alpha-galactosidase n=1 Tax=Algimonas arctica TaxID=1479486 RepID=A0A8J3CP89_9PROT|nr:alpha-galactosidase [Algimonas arctica]GHA89518.1 alpha-galactosidase [Algimonas arctica]